MSFSHPAFVCLLLCLCPSSSLRGGKRTDTEEDNTKKKTLFCSVPPHPFSITGAVLLGYFWPAVDIYSLTATYICDSGCCWSFTFSIIYIYIWAFYWDTESTVMIFPADEKISAEAAVSCDDCSHDIWVLTWVWRGVGAERREIREIRAQAGGVLL